MTLATFSYPDPAQGCLVVPDETLSLLLLQDLIDGPTQTLGHLEQHCLVKLAESSGEMIFAWET